MKRDKYAKGSLDRLLAMYSVNVGERNAIATASKKNRPNPLHPKSSIRAKRLEILKVVEHRREHASLIKVAQKELASYGWNQVIIVNSAGKYEIIAENEFVRRNSGHWLYKVALNKDIVKNKRALANLNDLLEVCSETIIPVRGGHKW